jgi:hypothetical protein
MEDICGKARMKETTKKGSRWVDNIEMDLREIGCGGMNPIVSY